MFGGEEKTKITYNTPEETKERTGFDFRGGVTFINKETKHAEIVIDSSLRPKLQQVYLEHEQAQLDFLRKEGVPRGESILPAAHQKGLRAGYRKARELGVEAEYKRHRGERV